MSPNGIEPTGESTVFNVPTEIGPWTLADERQSQIVWRQETGETDTDPEDGREKELFEYVSVEIGPHGGSWRAILRKGFADTTLDDRPQLTQIGQASRSNDGRDRMFTEAIEFMVERAEDDTQAPVGGLLDEERDLIQEVIAEEGADDIAGWHLVEPEDERTRFNHEAVRQWANDAETIFVTLGFEEDETDDGERDPQWSAQVTSSDDIHGVSNKPIASLADDLEATLDDIVDYLRSHSPNKAIAEFTATVEGGIIIPVVDLLRRYSRWALIEATADSLYVRGYSGLQTVELRIGQNSLESYDVQRQGEVAVKTGQWWDSIKDFNFSADVPISSDEEDSGHIRFGVGDDSFLASNPVEVHRGQFPAPTPFDAQFVTSGLNFRDVMRAARAAPGDTFAFGVHEGVPIIVSEGGASVGPGRKGDEPRETVTESFRGRFDAVSVNGDGVVAVSHDNLQDLRRVMPRPSQTDVKFTIAQETPILAEYAIDGIDVDLRVTILDAQKIEDYTLSVPAAEIQPTEAPPEEEADEEAAEEALEAVAEEAADEAADADIPERIEEFELVENTPDDVRWEHPEGEAVVGERTGPGWLVSLVGEAGSTNPVAAVETKAEVAAVAREKLEGRTLRDVRREARQIDEFSDTGVTNMDIRRATDNQVKGRPAQALAPFFDSVDEIRAATDNELLSIEGVGPKTLERIRETIGGPDPDETDESDQPLEIPIIVKEAVAETIYTPDMDPVNPSVGQEVNEEVEDAIGPPGQWEEGRVVGTAFLSREDNPQDRSLFGIELDQEVVNEAVARGATPESQAEEQAEGASAGPDDGFGRTIEDTFADEVIEAGEVEEEVVEPDEPEEPPEDDGDGDGDGFPIEGRVVFRREGGEEIIEIEDADLTPVDDATIQRVKEVFDILTDFEPDVDSAFLGDVTFTAPDEYEVDEQEDVLVDIGDRLPPGGKAAELVYRAPAGERVEIYERDVFIVPFSGLPIHVEDKTPEEAIEIAESTEGYTLLEDNREEPPEAEDRDADPDISGTPTPPGEWEKTEDTLDADAGEGQVVYERPEAFPDLDDVHDRPVTGWRVTVRPGDSLPFHTVTSPLRGEADWGTYTLVQTSDRDEAFEWAIRFMEMVERVPNGWTLATRDTLDFHRFLSWDGEHEVLIWQHDRDMGEPRRFHVTHEERPFEPKSVGHEVEDVGERQLPIDDAIDTAIEFIEGIDGYPDADTDEAATGVLVVGDLELEVPPPPDGWETIHFINRNLDNEEGRGDRVVYVSPDRRFSVVLEGTRVSNKWGVKVYRHFEPIPDDATDEELLFGVGGTDSEAERITLTSGNVVDAQAEDILDDTFPTVEGAEELFEDEEDDDTIGIDIRVDKTAGGVPIYAPPPNAVTLGVSRRIAEETEDEIGQPSQFDFGDVVGTAIVTNDGPPEEREFVRVETSLEPETTEEEVEAQSDFTPGQIQTIIEQATSGVETDVDIRDGEITRLELVTTGEGPFMFPRDDRRQIAALDDPEELIKEAVEGWELMVGLMSAVDDADLADVNERRLQLNEQFDIHIPLLGDGILPEDVATSDEKEGLDEDDIQTIVEGATMGLEAEVLIRVDSDSLRIILSPEVPSDVNYRRELTEVQGQASQPSPAIREAIQEWEDAVALQGIDFGELAQARDEIESRFGLNLPPVPGEGAGSTDFDEIQDIMQKFTQVREGMGLTNINPDTLQAQPSEGIPLEIESEMAQQIESTSRAEMESDDVVVGGEVGDAIRSKKMLEGVKQVEQGLQIHHTDDIHDEVHAAIATMLGVDDPEDFYDSSKESSLPGYDLFYTFTLSRDRDDQPWSAPRFKPSDLFEELDPLDGDKLKAVALAAPLA